MSAKLTDAVPTGKYGIASGTQVQLGLQIPLLITHANYDVGSGTIQSLSEYQLSAVGKYSVNFLGHKGNGTWTISVFSRDQGKSYNVSYRQTGTWWVNQSFTATAETKGTPGHDSVKIIYTGIGKTLKQSFQNDTLIQKAKVFFEFEMKTEKGKSTAATMYVYSAEYK